MWVVIARISVDPAKKAELLELTKGLIAATLDEDGCVGYHFLDNPYDPGACMFVEEWKNLKALTKHAISPLFLEWGKHAKDLLSALPVITVYRGTEFKI